MVHFARYGVLAILLGALLGANAQEEPPPVRFTVSAFAVEGDNPLTEAETLAILEEFKGDHDGVTGLLAAADALERAILDTGRSFYRVILPPQELDAGTVTLRVVVFRVGKVEVSGNEHFSEANILRSMPALTSGEPPRTRVLAKQLRLANEHPAKQVSLRFKESEEDLAIDGALTVRDTKPWLLVGSLANTGTDETGDWRLSLAAQHSNLFDLDHSGTIGLTSSPGHWSDVRQYSFNYGIPIYPWSGNASLYYVNSDADSGEVGGFDISGSGRFWGARYVQHLDRHAGFNQRVVLGFDDKLFGNDVLLAGVPLVRDVRSRPLSVQYEADRAFVGGNLSLYAGYARNTGAGRHNDTASYQDPSNGGPTAAVHWQALRFGGTLDRALPRDWGLRTLLNGQWTNDALIPGEQFGAGGVLGNPVRGFDERELSGDSGLHASVEFWAPPVQEQLRFLGFVDLARAWTEDAAVRGRVGSDTVASVGLGARWQMHRQVSLALDFGHVLNGLNLVPGQSGTRDGDNKLNANLMVRF